MIHTLQCVIGGNRYDRLSNEVFNRFKALTAQECRAFRYVIREEKRFCESNQRFGAYVCDVFKERGLKQFYVRQYRHKWGKKPFYNSKGEPNKNTDYYTYSVVCVLDLARLMGEDYAVRIYQGFGEFRRVSEAFNELMQELWERYGINLPDFACWNINRVDYCTNVPLPSNDFVKQYLTLLKHGDIPHYFLKDFEEDYNTHKDRYSGSRGKRIIKQRKGNGSYYVPCKSWTVNVYDREDRLKYKRYTLGGPVTDEDIESARGVLRVEYQSKGNKLKSLKHSFVVGSRAPHEVLSHGAAHEVMRKNTALLETGGSGQPRHCYYLTRRYLEKTLKSLLSDGRITESQHRRLMKLIESVNGMGGSIWRYRQQCEEEAARYCRTEEQEEKARKRARGRVNDDLAILYRHRISPVAIGNNLKDSNGRTVKWLPSLGELLAWTWEGISAADRINDECNDVCPDLITDTHEYALYYGRRNGRVRRTLQTLPEALGRFIDKATRISFTLSDGAVTGLTAEKAPNE